MLDLFDELKSFITRLNEGQKDYALCGGLALAIYGIPRATVDIDILISEESFGEVLPIADDLGYRLRATPMKFKGGSIEIHRLSKIDAETGDPLSLDFLLVTPDLKSVWENRRPVAWEGGVLWVVSKDGLIALKKLSILAAVRVCKPCNWPG